MNYQDVANAQSQTRIASSWYRSLLTRMASKRSAIDAAVLRSDGVEVGRLRTELAHLQSEAAAASEDVRGWRRVSRALST